MKKRIFGIILAVFMILALLPTMAFAAPLTESVETDAALLPESEPQDEADETEALRENVRLFAAGEVTLTDPTETVLREALADASISVVNASWSNELEITDAELTVPSGKTLNIVSGTLKLTGDATLTVEGGFDGDGELAEHGTLVVSGKLSIKKASEELNPPPTIVNNGVITFRGGEVSIDVINNYDGSSSADPKAIRNNGVITFEDGFRLSSKMGVIQVTPNPCAISNEKDATINIVGSGELYAKRKSGSAESIGAAITNYGKVNIGPAAPEATVPVGAEEDESRLTLNCMARIENDVNGPDIKGTMSVENCKLAFEPGEQVIPSGSVIILQNSSNMTIADSVIDVPINHAEDESDEVYAVSNSGALQFIGAGETRIESGRIEIKSDNSTAEVKEGTLTLETGSIIKCTQSAGVTIAADASMSINGGEVELTDGSLTNNGMLSINSGALSKNEFGNNHLIINSGAMTMSGGEISIPTSRYDHDLAMVRVKDGGRFTMSGGTIATPMSAGGDTPESYMGLVIDSDGEAVVLSNATISGNQGAAVINNGTLTIESNAQITGETPLKTINAPNGNLTVKVVPVGGAKVGSLPDCAQYTGSVAWTPLHTTFAYNAEYTADIEVEAASNYYFTNVTDSSFTVMPGSGVSRIDKTVTLGTGKPAAPTAALNRSSTIAVPKVGGKYALALNVSGILDEYNNNGAPTIPQPVTWTLTKTDGDNILTLPTPVTGTLSNDVLELGNFAVARNADGQPAKTATAHISFSGGEDYAALPADVAVVFNLAAAPAITAQPADTTVTVGRRATFSVTATGNPAPAYKWQLSADEGATWSDIGGATSASYTTDATTAEMSGWKYRCIVSNSAGNETSDAATLTVKRVIIDPEPGPIPGQTKPPTTPPATEPWVNPFKDVTENDWFYDAVKYCNENKLMDGVSADEFKPTGIVTRAEVWQVLANLAGVKTDTTKAPWYGDAQAWAMSVKITDGTNPTGEVTREQLITMLYRYYTQIVKGEFEGGMSAQEFDDFEDVSEWAELAVQWGVSDGIIEGSDNRLNPAGGATRAELAAMLMRFNELLKK